MKLSTSSIRFRMFSVGLKSMKSVASLTLLAVLAACSGTTSTSDGSGSSSGATASTAASLSLLVSSPQMNSDGKTDVVITVLAKDANNVGVAAQPVTVTASSGSVVLDALVTDVSGKVTGKLSALGDPSNRDITLTAISGSARSTNVVSVNGTSIQVSGSASLVFGKSTDIQFTLTDSSGAGVSRAVVTVTSSKGNGLSASSVTTDASGQAKVTVTGSVAGDDTIVFSALGATKPFAFVVSGADFQFITPSVSSANIGTPVPVGVQWKTSGNPEVGKPVYFSTTRGVLTSSVVNTDSSGVATATISSAESGAAIITAFGSGGVPFNTFNLYFNAVSASRIDVQSDKTNLSIYKANSPDSVATIYATVRDASNNLVKGAKVNFSLVADPSSGLLSSSVSTTDETGVATVKYTAGSTSSGQNAVEIKALVTDVNGVLPLSTVAQSMKLTVGGQSLFVRLGSDNKTASQSPLNVKTWAALVTDASGNPVPNTSVQFSVRPTVVDAYTKGIWVVAGRAWVQQPTVSCANEDLNFNGILDAGEDSSGDGNHDGLLTPGNIASVNKSAVTDASGMALAQVTYAKNYGAWARITLRASIQVAGSEFTQSVDFTLPIIADDYSDSTISPPGQESPFGVAALCTDSH